MHRISKIAAVAALLVLLLTSATPGSQNRVLMRVGGSAATIADHRLLFGSGIQQRQLIDTSLVMLAESLRKLEDARVTLGKTVTEDTFMLGRLMEWGQAITDITRLRTTLRAQTDSAAREKFFRENRNLFRCGARCAMCFWTSRYSGCYRLCISVSRVYHWPLSSSSSG